MHVQNSKSEKPLQQVARRGAVWRRQSLCPPKIKKFTSFTLVYGFPYGGSRLKKRPCLLGPYGFTGRQGGRIPPGNFRFTFVHSPFLRQMWVSSRHQPLVAPTCPPRSHFSAFAYVPNAPRFAHHFTGTSRLLTGNLWPFVILSWHDSVCAPRIVTHVTPCYIWL